MRIKAFTGALSVLAAASLALSGCSAPTSSSGSNGTIKIVAATDVYADIAKQVGGDKVEVTAIIASTSQDPHSYEATSADRLKTKDAQLVVINGGGYDLFLEDMAGKDNPNQKVVNAVKESGKLSDADYKHLVEDHAKGHSHESGDHAGHEHAHEFNEHIWYDMDSMKKTADKIAEDLASIDSANAETYRSNAKKFDEELDTISKDAKAINASGKKYLSTEPVPDYLISTTGAENATPEEFAEAVEAEQDVPALVLKETKDLVSEKKVQLVAYNEQTATNQTKEVLNEAKKAGVANVSFTETLPESIGYVSWMKTNVNNLKKALS
ncbi:MAG: metal ABC transporter substrate-binding protein [Rothia sp. (in: high G+C Gram-positive bacteria)]|uniref:metal ABC transporter substrate-binding protein n=1 Tax=Rothia sp. (in: high G+C Gram-positive bacteria) TaxID=1885016 RepID=UPI0026E069F4|nr:metal ABC transporter substrate-binding protein [Rothia sp. (in: high G+C Gram-positive bacteria)]MDO5750155.1 metal ABC transporter substrate-binding protein [Rothia sp. (in: high G+C Gram-positive bacteria)]